MSNEHTPSQGATPEREHPGDTRRRLLRTMAVGAAAAGAAGLAGARSASADDPNDLNLTVASNPHAGRTGANYTGPTVASSFTVESGPTAANNDTILNTTFANAGTAFIGLAITSGPEAIGVTGWSKVPLGTGVVGFTGGAGAYGGEFFRRPGGGAPAARRRGADHADQRRQGRGALRGRVRRALAVRPRRHAGHVA